MRPGLLRSVPLCVFGLLWSACVNEERSLPLAPPSFSITEDPVVTSRVLGPDGSTICNFLPPGAEVLGRLINPSPPPNFVGEGAFACPDNTLAMQGPPGTWLLRVQLPADPAIGSLPWRHLETEPVVFGEDVGRDVQIQNGGVLGGTATLDGSPVEGVALQFVYDQATGFAATSGGSGPDGTWREFFGRALILQNNVRYQTVGCGALGVRALEGPPPAGFLFPDEVSAVNCTLTTAPATQFSHDHTRLVVTPMPGDIGGQDFALAEQFGLGWGIQFPIGPGQAPEHVPVSATHMFQGGLLIGIAPDRILSGISLGGQLECGAACRDLGLDGVVAFTHDTPSGKRVIWRYSDATSPEGVGLHVVQTSLDGRAPYDYVLFRFSIQNRGPAAVTFHAGAFMDWDVGDDATDDIGFTELDGRLMAVTSAFEFGIHVGSLVIGAPVSGNLFYNFNGDEPIPSSTTDQFQALSGDVARPEIGLGDAHYIQGVGPVTLDRGRKVDIWLGIIAGEDRDQLLANGQAAAADIARRQQSDNAASDETVGAPQAVFTDQLGIPMGPLSKRRAPR